MPLPLGDDERKRLLAEVQGLARATLQKLWLPSPRVCVLQLRTAGTPGVTLLLVLDARLGLAAVASERPTAPESAPTAQATLRNALASARLRGAALEVGEERRHAAPRLDFETPRGLRSLFAGDALLLLDGARRIVWAAAGAGAARRPGSTLPFSKELPLDAATPLPRRESIVRAALRQEEEAGLAARRRELVARLKARLQKLRRTLAAVDEDAARAGQAQVQRHRAELLLPFASRIPRGAREARLPDWSRTDAGGVPAEVVVELDPALDAAANAQRWLKRAKRYQSAAARIAERRAEVAGDLARAEALWERALGAADAAELLRVEAEAPRGQQHGARRRQEPRLPYRTFQLESGARVLVGRSARDNDVLTFKVARGNDLWLHVRGLQGAHVVVPGPGDAPDSRTLSDAALLAVHFSSARDADAVEVAVTRCKHLRKPRGAAPGSVLVTQEKVLRVRRDDARLAALLRLES